MTIRRARAMGPAALAILLALGLAPARAADDPRDEIRERLDRTFERLREEAAAAMRPLVLYPEDVRDSILELSREPALIIRLHDARRASEPWDDALASGHPTAVGRAARVLYEEPQVLEILQEHVSMAGIVGATYEDDPIGLKKLVDASARRAEELERESVDDWKARLEKDPEARAELEAARAAYQEETGTAESGGSEPDASGTNTLSSGDTVVYAPPSYSFSVYVMSQPAYYPHLTSQMYYWSVDWDDFYEEYWDEYWDRADKARDDWQDWADRSREDRQAHREENREDWQSHREGLEDQGSGGLNRAMQDWKERKAESLPEDFFENDGKLSERFQSLDRTRADRAGREQGERVRPSEPRATGGSRPGVADGSAGLRRGEWSRSQRIDRASHAHRSTWGSGSRSSARGRGSFGGGRGGGRRR